MHALRPFPAAKLRQSAGHLRSYEASVVVSADGLKVLDQIAHHFPATTFTPDFFLASIEEKSWIPRITLVTRDHSPAGIVYAKERKIGPVHTGLVYVDTTLGGVSVTDPSLRQAVLLTGITELCRTRGVRGVRLAVPFHGSDLGTLREVSERASADFAYREAHSHSLLQLPFTYNRFLETLGPQTRRNFRYYRRRFEASGGEYVGSIAPDELERACADLKAQCSIECSSSSVGRALRMLSVVRKPLAVGLRQANGEWMSVLAGWLEDSRAVIFLQINRDIEFPKLSLSLVLRAYATEMLIANGVREILFWAGSGGALYRYSAEIPTAFVYLDKGSVTSRLCRRAISALGQRLPTELRPLTSWIAPPPEVLPEKYLPSERLSTAEPIKHGSPQAN